MQTSASDLTGLMSRVASGDRQAFADLYRATSVKLFGVVLRILKRRELAEEILQEVYLRIWDNAGSFDRSRASPITWMATIARNRALDEVRKRQLDVAPVDVGELEIAASDKLPSEQAELNEELRRLEACLDRLDPDRKDAIKRAYLDGASRKELAERYDQPVGTIKTWLHRGLKQLKECLGT